MSGHLPPPMGGMATFYQSLLSSSLPSRLDLHFVQTSSQARALSMSGSTTLSNLASAARDCIRFARAVFLHRPGVSHIATAPGLSLLKHGVCVAIARILRTRVLLHPHCSLSVLYTERAGWWQWVFRRIFKLAHGVVALSSEWMQIRSIVPSCQVYRLPNAIDLAPYRRLAQGRIARRKGKSSLKVLYLGYLGRAKGSFDLIEAAKQALSKGIDLSLDLVGDELTPGVRRELLDCIDDDKLGQTVRLHSPASGPVKLAFFRDADVFVYPSYHEGMPIAVLEAMASGLPVVATRVGGLPDLVIDGINGLLLESGRPDQLANALVSLSADGERRRSMQQMSHQLAIEKYDLEQCVTQLVRIYRAVLSNGLGR